jgi:hypothetical protein
MTRDPSQTGAPRQYAAPVRRLRNPQILMRSALFFATRRVTGGEMPFG